MHIWRLLSGVSLKQPCFLCKNGASVYRGRTCSHFSWVTIPPSPNSGVEGRGGTAAPLSQQAELSRQTLTYYVQVGGVGWAGVALHPRWGACLHVDKRGPQAVDVCFCGMAPAQDHLWAHVNLKKTRKHHLSQFAFPWTHSGNWLFCLSYLIHASSLWRGCHCYGEHRRHSLQPGHFRWRFSAVQQRTLSAQTEHMADLAAKSLGPRTH